MTRQEWHQLEQLVRRALEHPELAEHESFGPAFKAVGACAAAVQDQLACQEEHSPPT